MYSKFSHYIVRIHSNGYGQPDTAGNDYHFVVLTDNPHPVAINQLADGGHYPHADCGESCSESILRDFGVTDNILNVEHQEDGTTEGTTAVGVIKCFDDYGIKAVQTNKCPSGQGMTIMNPLGGLVLEGDKDWGAYEKAYAGITIEVSCGTLVVQPKPSEPVPEPTPLVTRPSPPERNDLPPFSAIHGCPEFTVTAIADGIRIHYGPGVNFPVAGAPLNHYNRVHCNAWARNPATPGASKLWFRINHLVWINANYVLGRPNGVVG
jgi:hypothetical protein